MFLLIPKKVRIETSMTPKQCREKLNRDLETYSRKSGFLSASQFIKSHKLESCYFGSSNASGKVRIFYHRAKKYDGSSAGFFGTISKRTDGKGAVIEGKIRRSVSTVIVAVVWFLSTLLFTLGFLGMRTYDGAVIMGLLCIFGTAAVAYDGSQKYVRDYLESFPKV